MSRVAISADLHVGITSPNVINQMISYLRDELKPDAIVLAGDIAESVSEFEWAIKEFATLGIPLGVVAGNHDVWSRDGEPSSKQLFWDVLPNIVKKYGGVWLDDENLILKDGTAVAGSIGWYDYSDRSNATQYWTDEQFVQYKKEMEHGDRNVNWSYTDKAFAKYVGERLVSRLTELEKDENVKQVLVATHTALVREQNVLKDGDFPVNRSFYANFTLGEQVLGFNKVTQLCCGHTHRGVKAQPIRAVNGDVIAHVVPSTYHAPRLSLVELPPFPSLRQLNQFEI